MFAKPANWELVTPYKLVILALIKNYAEITDERHPLYKCIVWQDGNASKRKLNKALFVWMQQPDGVLKNILQTVESCSKVLHAALCSNLKQLCLEKCSENLITSVSTSLFELEDGLLQNNGAVSLFCRRIILYYDQIPFCYLSYLHENFCKYCSILLSKKRQMESKSAERAKLESALTSSGDEANSVNQSGENNESVMASDSMELESQSELDSRSSNESIGDVALKTSDLKSISIKESENLNQVFTSAQAGRFFAEQASYIINKETMALPPNQLQLKINYMVKGNPQLAEAYYLSYLNSLRVKEYCGAIDSLLVYFNHNLSTNNNISAPSKAITDNTCQYAALNMAFLHYYFGNKSLALQAANEAFRLCNIANDAVCLNHVVSLFYQLDPKLVKMPSLLERVKLSRVLKLPRLTADDLQRQANADAFDKRSPVQITLELMSSQLLSHAISPLNYCHFGCLLKMYGKTSLAILTFQQALAFQTCKINSFDYTQKNSEEIILSICHMLETLSEEGDWNASNEMLNHLKTRFPIGTQHAHLWQLSSLKLQHKIALLCRRFSEALHLENEMTVIDPLEASIAKAQRLYNNEDLENCYMLLKTLVKAKKKDEFEDKSNVMAPETLCRINILFATVLSAKSSAYSLALSYALQAYMMAKKSYLHGLVVEVVILICQLHLHNGFKELACNLLKTISYECMTNGVLMQRSRFLLVYVKCHLVKNNSNFSLEFVNRCIKLLKKAKRGFAELQDGVRKKMAVFMLARLCNIKLELLPVKNTHAVEDYNKVLSQRNTYAMRFNQLDQATLHYCPNVF